MAHNSFRLRTLVLSLLTLVLFGSSARAQQGLPVSDTLYQQIIRMDSILFDAVNNNRPGVVAEVFDSTLEFYHDKTGLTFYEHNVKAMSNIKKNSPDLRRELVPGTTEIYPVPGYGAMQIGKHQFCHTENGRKDCGTFKFLHIWQQKNGKWKLSRVISYDHG